MQYACKVNRAYTTGVSITAGGGYTVFCTLYDERYAGPGIHGFSGMLKARGYSSICFVVTRVPWTYLS